MLICPFLRIFWAKYLTQRELYQLIGWKWRLSGEGADPGVENLRHYPGGVRQIPGFKAGGQPPCKGGLQAGGSGHRALYRQDGHHGRIQHWYDFKCRPGISSSRPQPISTLPPLYLVRKGGAYSWKFSYLLLLPLRQVWLALSSVNGWTVISKW